jgi:hypothetical protein
MVSVVQLTIGDLEMASSLMDSLLTVMVVLWSLIDMMM